METFQSKECSMSKPLQWLLGIFLGTCTLAVGLGIYGLWGGWHQILVAVDLWGESAPGPTKTIAKGLTTALDTINAPCIGNEPCRGTLGALNKTIIKVGDAVVTTQIKEREITPHTIAAMDKFGEAADKFWDASDALKETANGATDSLKAATGLIQTMNVTPKRAYRRS
jgi:hypothetical protein